MSDNKVKNEFQLTDAQLDVLSDLVIAKMADRANSYVGKKVIGGLGKFFYYVGALVTALYLILKSKGYIS